MEALEAAHEAELKALKASFADERTHLMAVHENRIERHRKSVEQRVCDVQLLIRDGASL